MELRNCSQLRMGLDDRQIMALKLIDKFQSSEDKCEIAAIGQLAKRGFHYFGPR